MPKYVIDPDRLMEAVEGDDYTGFCINCGAERGECEPDSREYLCEDCGQRKVYGAAELLIMGYAD